MKRTKSLPVHSTRAHRAKVVAASDATKFTPVAREEKPVPDCLAVNSDPDAVSPRFGQSAQVAPTAAQIVEIAQTSDDRVAEFEARVREEVAEGLAIQPNRRDPDLGVRIPVEGPGDQLAHVRVPPLASPMHGAAMQALHASGIIPRNHR